MAAVTLPIPERLSVGLQQLVQVHDYIFHLRIVHSPLRRTAPCFFGFGEIGEDSDDIELIKLAEIKRLRVFNATAKDQMKFG